MPESKLPLLYNPIAGRGALPRRLRSLSPVFERSELAVEPRPSTAAGDIEAMAKALSDEGAERILIAGGDGSVHEAVNGVLASDTPAALGVIPLGTGNDFAKANAIPIHAVQAIELLADRLNGGVGPRLVDAGRINGRWFGNGAGIGFDARVATIADSMRRPAGKLVYLLALLRHLAAGIDPPRVVLEFEGRRIDGPVTLAAFNLGPWTGGLFPIAPMARNDDGRIDLVYADALTRWQLMKLLPKLLDGGHVDDPAVHHASIAAARVTGEAPLVAHADGEILPPAREFEITIAPAVLSLL